MKWIGLYLIFGILWMMLEELIATVQDNDRYKEYLKSMNALELILVRAISVVLWPIPMVIWFRSFRSDNKNES